MGLSAVLAGAKNGVGSGYDRGSRFSSGNLADITAYGVELEGMGVSKKAGHLVGVAAGEILNICSLGILAYSKMNRGIDRSVNGDLEAEVADAEGETGSDNGYDVAEEEDSVNGYDVAEEDEDVGDDYVSVVDVGERKYSANGKGKKRGKKGDLEKSVRAVAAIIEKGRKDVRYGKANVDSVVKNVNSALREYEARTGNTLDGAVLRGLDEIIAKEKRKGDKRYSSEKAEVVAHIIMDKQYAKDWDNAHAENKWFNGEKAKADKKVAGDIAGRALQDEYWVKFNETVARQMESLDRKKSGLANAPLTEVYKRASGLYLSGHDVWYVDGMISNDNKNKPREKRAATVSEKAAFVKEIKGMREARQHRNVTPKVNKPALPSEGSKLIGGVAELPKVPERDDGSEVGDLSGLFGGNFYK